MSSFSYLGVLGFSYKPLTFENHIKVQLSVSSLLAPRYRFRLRSSSWSQDHFWVSTQSYPLRLTAIFTFVTCQF